MRRRGGIREAQIDISQKEKKGKQKYWYYKLGNLKKYCWKGKNPMMNPQRMQVWLRQVQIWSMKYYMFVISHNIIRNGY